MNEKIIVGVSGGVDSSLAVLLLKEQGWDVRAVHLVTTGTEDEDDLARLCRLEQEYSIPLMRLDCRQRFEKNVIEPFLNAYRRGETPNPCIICNPELKFRALVEEADAQGIKYIATGHYARIVRDGSEYVMVRTSSKKDQTYALYRLPAEWLSRIIFPLADMPDKTAVREKLAASFGTGVFKARESQDICFLEDQPLEAFLKGRLSPEECFPGHMVDEYGHVLGAHKGLIFYTEGQRKGLGLSRGPWFVAERDFKSGVMRLKHGRESKSTMIFFDRAVWHKEATLGANYSVQYCYRFPPVEAQLIEYDGTGGAVRLLTPCGGVSIGQSLVFYQNERLLGGGIITNFQEMEERE